MARQPLRTTRAAEAKEETYTPPFSYDIPYEVREKFNGEGYHLRWVRVILDNQDDYKNVADRRREGYEPVMISDLPIQFRDLFETKSFGPSTGKYSSIAMVGDLALFKIPLGKAEARQRYYEKMALESERAQMKQLGGNSKLNKLLPISDESSTQVRVGNRQNAPQEFGKTLKETVASDDDAE
jgi:hypothetical protein